MCLMMHASIRFCRHICILSSTPAATMQDMRQICRSYLQQVTTYLQHCLAVVLLCWAMTKVETRVGIAPVWSCKAHLVHIGTDQLWPVSYPRCLVLPLFCRSADQVMHVSGSYVTRCCVLLLWCISKSFAGECVFRSGVVQVCAVMSE